MFVNNIAFWYKTCWGTNETPLWFHFDSTENPYPVLATTSLGEIPSRFALVMVENDNGIGDGIHLTIGAPIRWVNGTSSSFILLLAVDFQALE